MNKEKKSLKKNKNIKRVAIASIIFSVLLGFSTIIIGNYFVDYSLVTTGESGDRKVSDEETTSAEKNSNESLIKEAIAKEQEIENEWKSSVKSENIYITADDGAVLKAVKYFAENKTDKWIILAHGYHSNPEKVLSVGVNFSQQGYNVLSLSMRAHAESGGEYIGMGWLDRLDLLKWINLIVSENPNSSIVLHGTSMGGASVMMVSGENLPSNVKAIVEECGYTSVWDIFASELKLRFKLPAFPVLDMVNLVAMNRAGYNIKEASALNQVKKSKVPILFIHGDVDDFVPVEMVYKLYNAANCEKDILVVEGASHSEARYVDFEAYYSKVFSFVNKYVS